MGCVMKLSTSTKAAAAGLSLLAATAFAAPANAQYYAPRETYNEQSLLQLCGVVARDVREGIIDYRCSFESFNRVAPGYGTWPVCTFAGQNDYEQTVYVRCREFPPQRNDNQRRHRRDRNQGGWNFGQ